MGKRGRVESREVACDSETDSDVDEIRKRVRRDEVKESSRKNHDHSDVGGEVRCYSGSAWDTKQAVGNSIGGNGGDGTNEESRGSVSGRRGNFAANCGIVEGIVCVNFMCHSRLEVRLGPLINFIIGHNGSGKSAVLTALTLCLGCKASYTNRGQNLKAFIKEGRESAMVAVRLKNQGEGAFKREVYGHTIIVERHFTRGGTSGFKIKNGQGKIISTKRSDLEDITDAFALQLDNPMMVLTQDMAREFLNNSSPLDKYKFFYRGTQLESLDRDYGMIEEFLDSIERKLRFKASDLNMYEDQHKELLKKIELAEKHQTIGDRIREIGRQMAWAQVEEQERNLADYESKEKEAKRKIEKVEELIEGVDSECKHATEKVDGWKEKVNEAKEVVKQLMDELEKVQEEFDEGKNAIFDIVKQEREIRGELQTAKKALENTQMNIKREDERMERIDGGQCARKKEELKEAQDELENVLAKIKQWSEARENVQREVREAREKYHVERERLEAKRKEVEEKERLIWRLKKDRNEWVKAYPRGLKELMEEINKAKDKFKAGPIGPLGCHIKLKEAKWSSVLERSFGGMLNSFVVKSQSDGKILDGLMKNVGYPRIILIGDDEKLNIRAHEPDSSIVTSLRVLEINEDIVRNQVIINQSVEQSALCESIDSGVNLITKLRPKNVKRCFALNVNRRGAGQSISISSTGGVVMTPIAPWVGLPRMRTDIDSQADIERENLEDMKEEEKERKRRVKEREEELRRTEKHFEDVDDEGRDLKLEEKVIREKVEKLEDELMENGIQGGNGGEGCGGMNQIEGLKELLKENKEEVETLEKLFEKATEEKETLMEKQKERIEKIGGIKENIESKKNHVNEIKSRVRSLEEKAEDKAREMRKLGDELTRSREELASAKQLVERQVKVVEEFVEQASKIVKRVKVWKGESYESLEAKLEKLSNDRAEVEKAGQMTQVEELSSEVEKSREKIRLAKEQYEGLKETAQLLKRSLINRRERWLRFRQHISTRARTQFANKLAQRKFRGRMIIDHEKQELDIRVEPDINRMNTFGYKTKSLSGGEKSFSTICLLLALWDAMGSSLRCLDEFDVFMDNVNRSASMSMMIDAARESVSRQFILISPQAMGNIDLSEDVRIIKMNDPERGQSLLPY